MNRCTRQSARCTGLLAGIASLACPVDAAAHLVTTGMGPIYDGIGHLLLTPEDLVPVLALALYAGMRGTRTGRQATWLLPLAWFTGGLFGELAGQSAAFPIPAVSFLVLGGLVAADLGMPARAVSVLAVVIGLGHGFLNGSAAGAAAGILGLIGITIMLFVLVALGAALVLSLGTVWARMAIRVIGSWVFASGVLMVGWYFHGVLRP